MNTKLNTHSQLQTLRDVWRYAISRFNAAQVFFGHGSSNAQDEAAYLILHSLHLPLDELALFLDARLLPDEINKIIKLIERRCTERLPAAYLTGEAWLQGYRFRVTSDTIVPRSFIAELLKEQCAPWIAEPDAIQHVLDVCTGSGCLAIMAADAFPQAHIEALDLSTAALAIAQQNVTDYALEQRITLHHSDLFNALPKTPTQRFDLIISNPPYVNTDSMQQLPAEYQHEPDMALAGGTDGMDLVRRILHDAVDHLSDTGVLIVEIGNEYDYCCQAFPDLPMTWLDTSGGNQQVFLVQAPDLQHWLNNQPRS